MNNTRIVPPPEKNASNTKSGKFQRNFPLFIVTLYNFYQLPPPPPPDPPPENPPPPDPELDGVTDDPTISLILCMWETKSLAIN